MLPQLILCAAITHPTSRPNSHEPNTLNICAYYPVTLVHIRLTAFCMPKARRPVCSTTTRREHARGTADSPAASNPPHPPLGDPSASRACQSVASIGRPWGAGGGGPRPASPDRVRGKRWPVEGGRGGTVPYCTRGGPSLLSSLPRFFFLISLDLAQDRRTSCLFQCELRKYLLQSRRAPAPSTTSTRRMRG